MIPGHKTQMVPSKPCKARLPKSHPRERKFRLLPAQILQRPPSEELKLSGLSIRLKETNQSANIMRFSSSCGTHFQHQLKAQLRSISTMAKATTPSQPQAEPSRINTASSTQGASALRPFAQTQEIQAFHAHTTEHFKHQGLKRNSAVSPQWPRLPRYHTPTSSTAPHGSINPSTATTSSQWPNTHSDRLKSTPQSI